MDENKIEIVTDDLNTFDMLRELKALKKPVEADEPRLVSMTSIKKKCKDKKKKKKGKRSTQDLLDAIVINDADDNEEYNFVDIEAMIEAEDEYEDTLDIIGNEKGNYNKLKSHKSIYKQEFAEVLTLLYSELDDLTKITQLLEKKYDSIENSKTRGISKFGNDLVQNLLSARTNKLQVLKEIGSIKKTISDFDLKAKRDDKDVNSSSASQVATNYLQGIIKHGRNNFISSLKDELDIEQGSNLANRLESDANDLPSMRDQELIDDMLDNMGSANGTSSRDEGDRYIEYEHMKVKLYIRRNIDSGDWSMVALDKNQQLVPDYPVPDRDMLGTVKFSADNLYASDKYGRSYKVIEVFDEEDL